MWLEMRKMEVLLVIGVLVAIVLSASSLYYVTSVMDAVNRSESRIGSIQSATDSMQNKINSLWSEVFGKPVEEKPPLEGQILKMGAVLPLSGANAPMGTEYKRGLELSVDEINAAGGILGAFIQLIVEDHGGDPKVGMSSAEKLIVVDRCQVLRGGVQSPVALAMMEVTEKYEVPFLAHAPVFEVTMKGYKYIFQQCSNTTDKIMLQVRFLMEVVKPKRIAYLHGDDLPGHQSFQIFYNLSKALHAEWEIVSHEAVPITVDYRPVLEKIRTTNPDLFQVNLWPAQAVKVSEQLKEMGWHPVITCGEAPVFDLFESLKMLGEDMKYWFGIQEFWPDRQYPNAKAVSDLGKEYWLKYTTPFGPFAWSAYMGTTLVKLAIEKTKNLDPKKIRDTLFQVEFEVPWYGKVKFYPNGHMATKPSVAQVQPARNDEPWNVNGLTYHTVYPPPYNSSTYIRP